MGVIKALDGNAAIAHGVMRSKVQLVAAYAAQAFRDRHRIKTVSHGRRLPLKAACA